MKEVWKTIKGSKHEVSSLGNVRYVNYIRPVSSLGNVRCVNYIKPEQQSTGYETYSIKTDNGKGVKRAMLSKHRILAEAFIPNPNNLHCVNHKNGIRNDNRIENLEWVTVQRKEQYS